MELCLQAELEKQKQLRAEERKGRTKAEAGHLAHPALRNISSHKNHELIIRQTCSSQAKNSRDQPCLTGYIAADPCTQTHMPVCHTRAHSQ